jgi:diguanylate cyclase (GGDEF)-like protein
MVLGAVWREAVLTEYFGASRYIQRGEARVLLVFAIILAALLFYHDAFDVFAEFVEQHEEWQLDELVSVVFIGSFASIVLLFRRSREMGREINRREEAEATALTLARHDPLTGLPNRRQFNEELAGVLTGIQNSGNECAVFLIDLDRFKTVNDLHGHAVGDALLVEVAARLKSICKSGTSIARLGGDEFVCIHRYAPGSEAPARLAASIIRTLGEPFDIGGVQLEAKATVGIARCPIDATAPTDLLRAADVAMYEGKGNGKGVYRFFHAEMDARLRDRSALENDLRAAVEQGQLRPYFQPIVALDGNEISGFEALARWDHPTRGLLMPDLFIPVAEDLGIIDLLTYRILRESCLASRDWPPHMSLSVNISPMQLKDPWLSSRILAILAETHFSPGRLIIEVTEKAIIDDMSAAAEVFTSLQKAGIRIALDDFGMGYSSLYHLRQLRFDHLKIDSSFVLSMESSESEKIVRAITGLGRSLGMTVTAEGVETNISMDALRDCGCEQAQGYLLGAPIAAEETARLFDVAASKPLRKIA